MKKKRSFLFELRSALGLTQDEMADKVDMERSTYANFETGRRELRGKALKKIRRKVGWSIQRFYKKFEDSCDN